MNTKLVCVGDSWCYGSDLGDHRETLRYSTLLKQKIGADTVVNISKPGISNSYMIFSLLNWLAEEDYLSGKNDITKLFISIGWTSPERFDIFPQESVANSKPYWHTIGPWIFNIKDANFPVDPQYREHLEFFYAYLKSPVSDYYNWLSQVIMVQNLLQNLKIRYCMHQAIYNNTHYLQEHDYIKHRADFKGLKPLWESVDSNAFMRKNEEHSSLYSYLKNNHKETQTLNELGDHPNKHGHEIISDLLYSHIKENNL